MYNFLREKSFTYESALEHFASDLVHIPSLSFHEAAAAQRVKVQLEDLGYDKVFIDSIGNVVGCNFGRNYSPTLLLISHLDTIHAAPSDTSCKAGIFDGKLYGCGASDCKGGLASQVFAGRLLKESFPMYGNLIVLASVAEQNGCSIGVRHFLKETLPSLGLTPSFAILGEPTDLGLYYGHDGWVAVEISLSDCDEQIVKYASGELLSFINKSNLNATLENQLVEEIVVNGPTYFKQEGFTKAQFRVVHRIRNKTEPAHVLHRYGETARHICRPLGVHSISTQVSRSFITDGLGENVRIRQVVYPWTTDPLHPIFEESRLALRAADCTVRGGSWKLPKLGMGTAGNVLTKNNIPVIGYGPGSEILANDPQEYVELNNLKEAFFGTAVIAHRMLGVPSVGKD
jgi:acetylornithine deacetylase/succinyl-diaminopimelate desuccinylase-like protein